MYSQGLMLVLIILITGTAMEWINKGLGTGFPSYPINIYIGLVLILFIVLLHIFFRNTSIIKSLSSIPVSISAITLFTLLVLLMGLTDQSHSDTPALCKLTGLNHIRKSYTFLLSGTYLMIILGLVILRRIRTFNLRNCGFILNHLGLWIIIFAGSLGSGDLIRLNLTANKGQIVWYGMESGYKPVILPFMIKLLDFSMKEYPAKILVVDEEDPDYAEHIHDYIYELEEGSEVNVNNWNFKVLKYLPEAERDSSGYRSSTDTLSYQAALIQVKNEESGILTERWITTGNYFTTPEYIIFDSTYMLGMTIPEAREYSSKIEIITNEDYSDTAEILVNKPINVKGYKLYQLSYDQRKGKHSTMSVIEAVKDPWLPLVYTGIIMVIAGAFYLFWTGRNTKI